MADDQALSPQDIQDLQEISSKLPAGHPTQKKISMAINSQPTQFEQQNAAPPAPTEGAGMRTVEGVGRGLNNLVEGAYQTIAHPIDTANGLINSTTQHIKQGMQEPSTVGKLAEYGAAVPGLGPVGQSIGKRAAGGDVAGAVSEGLTTAVAPEIAKGVVNTASKLGDMSMPNTDSIGRTLRDPGRQYEGKFPASTAVRRGPLKPGLNKIPVVGSLMDAITPGHPEPYDNAPTPPKTPAPLPSQGEVIHKLKPWANNTQEPSNPIPSRMPKSQQTGTGGFQEEPPSVGQKIKGGVGKSGLILPPDAPAPHVEGSYWSFNEGALRKAVMAGDRDAATVYKQRFGDLPPNAGLLTDVGAKPTRGLYRSQK